MAQDKSKKKAQDSAKKGSGRPQKNTKAQIQAPPPKPTAQDNSRKAQAGHVSKQSLMGDRTPSSKAMGKRKREEVESDSSSSQSSSSSSSSDSSDSSDPSSSQASSSSESSSSSSSSSAPSTDATASRKRKRRRRGKADQHERGRADKKRSSKASESKEAARRRARSRSRARSVDHRRARSKSRARSQSRGRSRSRFRDSPSSGGMDSSSDSGIGLSDTDSDLDGKNATKRRKSRKRPLEAAESLITFQLKPQGTQFERVLDSSLTLAAATEAVRSKFRLQDAVTFTLRCQTTLGGSVLLEDEEDFRAFKLRAQRSREESTVIIVEQEDRDSSMQDISRISMQQEAPRLPGAKSTAPAGVPVASTPLRPTNQKQKSKPHAKSHLARTSSDRPAADESESAIQPAVVQTKPAAPKSAPQVPTVDSPRYIPPSVRRAMEAKAAAAAASAAAGVAAESLTALDNGSKANESKATDAGNATDQSSTAGAPYAKEPPSCGLCGSKPFHQLSDCPELMRRGLHYAKERRQELRDLKQKKKQAERKALRDLDTWIQGIESGEKSAEAGPVSGEVSELRPEDRSRSDQPVAAPVGSPRNAAGSTTPDVDHPVARPYPGGLSPMRRGSRGKRRRTAQTDPQSPSVPGETAVAGISQRPMEAAEGMSTSEGGEKSARPARIPDTQPAQLDVSQGDNAEQRQDSSDQPSSSAQSSGEQDNEAGTEKQQRPSTETFAPEEGTKQTKSQESPEVDGQTQDAAAATEPTTAIDDSAKASEPAEDATSRSRSQPTRKAATVSQAKAGADEEARPQDPLANTVSRRELSKMETKWNKVRRDCDAAQKKVADLLQRQEQGGQLTGTLRGQLTRGKTSLNRMKDNLETLESELTELAASHGVSRPPKAPEIEAAIALKQKWESEAAASASPAKKSEPRAEHVATSDHEESEDELASQYVDKDRVNRLRAVNGTATFDSGRIPGLRSPAGSEADVETSPILRSTPTTHSDVVEEEPMLPPPAAESASQDQLEATQPQPTPASKDGKGLFLGLTQTQATQAPPNGRSQGEQASPPAPSQMPTRSTSGRSAVSDTSDSGSETSDDSEEEEEEEGPEADQQSRSDNEGESGTDSGSASSEDDNDDDDNGEDARSDRQTSEDIEGTQDKGFVPQDTASAKEEVESSRSHSSRSSSRASSIASDQSGESEAEKDKEDPITNFSQPGEQSQTGEGPAPAEKPRSSGLFSSFNFFQSSRPQSEKPENGSPSVSASQPTTTSNSKGDADSGNSKAPSASQPATRQRPKLSMPRLSELDASTLMRRTMGGRRGNASSPSLSGSHNGSPLMSPAKANSAAGNAKRMPPSNQAQANGADSDTDASGGDDDDDDDDSESDTDSDSDSDSSADEGPRRSQASSAASGNQSKSKKANDSQLPPERSAMAAARPKRAKKKGLADLF
ncbi:unnamed protein product [Jaminaea pallidilutea]